LPFREAHEVVGKVLRAAEQDGKSIRDLPIARLKEFSSAFGDELGNALTVESALARKAPAGGTSPTAVRSALDEFKKRVAATSANARSGR
jgi:argininosuccinate lyase